MDKLKMHTPNKADENFKKLAALFPNAVTETINENGEVVRAIDKDVLMQEISCTVVDGNEERYQFTWPDKKKSVLLANAPIAKTLRPCREESVGKDGTPCGFDSENLYIEGDNLEVLKLLQETYLGKIKMIYIDPPYNTGNDFVYEDDFAQSTQEYMENSGQFDEEGNRLVANTESNGRFHTDWLNMIYPRLRLAKDLLTDDGVIFISIDDNEVNNLKNICNEIFGESNFVSNIVWQSTAGSNTGTDIVTVTENILVYTKNRALFTFDGMIASDSSYVYSDEYESIRGKYGLDKLDRRRVGSHYSDALNYPITMPDGSIRYPGGTEQKSNEGWNYLWSQTKVQWGIKNGFIEFKKLNGNWGVYNKRYAKVDNEGKPIERTIPFRNLITSDQCNTAQGTAELRSLFEIRPFDFPKPSGIVKHLLLTSVRSCHDALILDFFSGSASTAHAIMQLNAEDGGNRKFIMVQLPEETDVKSEAYKAGYKNICEIGKERIRRAGKKIKEDSPLTTQDLDIGFRVLKCDTSNMKDVYYSPADYEADLFDFMTDNIKEDRTPEDLLFQVMLDLGIELSSKIEETVIADKKVFNVADGFLIACFDADVTDETIKAIAQKQPYYFVMRDSSLANDSVAANFEQIFAAYSPDTVRKVL
ncbi:MAG: site-specific DNA-methyltransferase [Clostridium sp.]|nr:site-specific DNA-methyltransferase [Clostridium sp.]